MVGTVQRSVSVVGIVALQCWRPEFGSVWRLDGLSVLWVSSYTPETWIYSLPMKLARCAPEMGPILI